MLLSAVTPLPGHAVFLLLLQLALLLAVARIGASLSRAVGLPAVVGELAAGIVLGPTVFGHFASGAFATVFSQTSEQFHLLEAVGVLGIVLLMLLTGIETDLKLLRNLGRAALVTSVLGMMLPFGMGFALGEWMPDAYLAQPDRRTIFALFLATAMAISAMPVIAKILMDLQLTRRNIGLVILSAGVVDDTAGWLILSVIAGAATHGGVLRLSALGMTFVWMAVFLLAMALLAYPLLKLTLRLIARERSPDTELVVIVAFAFLCAALTEQIGIHAVFGAFIAGTALRQVPHLKHETVARLETFVFSILAPVFFGTVGLHVNLWSLGGGGGTMLAIVLGIACVGKLVGCTIGGVWGGLSLWEAVSIAVAMNARGAMGLVLASIGLSLGILNQQMFSIIVVVAIATSFMAPVALRLTMRLVRMSRDEEERILAETSRGVLDPSKLRVLVPTAGGPNAIIAAKLGFGLTKNSTNPVEILYVDERGTFVDRIRHMFKPTEAGRNLEQHFAALRELGGDKAPRLRRVAGRDAADAVVEEAKRGVDLILAGASGGTATVGGRVLEEIVNQAPCHVAIVKAGKRDGQFRRVFVPVDGSSVSRVAAELGLHYAEAVGAELTLGMLSERRAPMTSNAVLPDAIPSSLGGIPPEGDVAHELADFPSARMSELPFDPLDELARVSPVFRVSKLRPRIERIDYEPGLGTVSAAIQKGGYDLVVLGAENRAVRRRLFFGHENQRIIALDSVTTAIIIPRLARQPA